MKKLNYILCIILFCELKAPPKTRFNAPPPPTHVITTWKTGRVKFSDPEGGAKDNEPANSFIPSSKYLNSKASQKLSGFTTASSSVFSSYSGGQMVSMSPEVAKHTQDALTVCQEMSINEQQKKCFEIYRNNFLVQIMRIIWKQHKITGAKTPITHLDHIKERASQISRDFGKNDKFEKYFIESVVDIIFFMMKSFSSFNRFLSQLPTNRDEIIYGVAAIFIGRDISFFKRFYADNKDYYTNTELTFDKNDVDFLEDALTSDELSSIAPSTVAASLATVPAKISNQQQEQHHYQPEFSEQAELERIERLLLKLLLDLLEALNLQRNQPQWNQPPQRNQQNQQPNHNPGLVAAVAQRPNALDVERNNPEVEKIFKDLTKSLKSNLTQFFIGNSTFNNNDIVLYVFSICSNFFSNNDISDLFFKDTKDNIISAIKGIKHDIDFDYWRLRGTELEDQEDQEDMIPFSNACINRFVERIIDTYDKTKQFIQHILADGDLSKIFPPNYLSAIIGYFLLKQKNKLNLIEGSLLSLILQIPGLKNDYFLSMMIQHPEYLLDKMRNPLMLNEEEIKRLKNLMIETNIFGYSITVESLDQLIIDGDGKPNFSKASLLPEVGKQEGLTLWKKLNNILVNYKEVVELFKSPRICEVLSRSSSLSFLNSDFNLLFNLDLLIYFSTEEFREFLKSLIKFAKTEDELQKIREFLIHIPNLTKP